MISWSKTISTEFGSAIFRHKHPAQSYAGRCGLFALTQIVDFSNQMIWVEAANDLADANISALEHHPIYIAASQKGPVGIAICQLPMSSEFHRLRMAAAINRQLWPESQAA